MGEWLVPGPARGSNAVRPGVKTQRGLALVHPLRDAGEPSVVRADDVALLPVSQAAGVGRRGRARDALLPGCPEPKRVVHLARGNPGFRSDLRRAELDPATTSRCGKTVVSSGTAVGRAGLNPFGRSGSGNRPQVSQAGNAGKPEIEDEYRHIAAPPATGFGPSRPKCSLWFNRNATTLRLRGCLAPLRRTGVPRVGAKRPAAC